LSDATGSPFLFALILYSHLKTIEISARPFENWIARDPRAVSGPTNGVFEPETEKRTKWDELRQGTPFA